jgi:ribonuclease HI
LWVLQRNWRGFTRQKQESLLNSTLKEAGPQPDIVLLIDTHLADRVATAHHVAGYSMYHRERPNQTVRGGVGILVRNSPDLTHRLAFKSDGEDIEAIGVEVAAAGHTQLYISAYAPDYAMVTQERLDAALQHVIQHPDKSVVLGADFNTHHEMWDSQPFSERGQGEELLQWLAVQGMLLANDPTKATRQGEQAFGTARAQSEWRKSSPDITAVRGPVIQKWDTTFTAESDHAIITYSVGSGEECSNNPKRAFWNTDKANWTKFAAEVDRLFDSNMPLTIAKAQQLIRQAACAHIPRGFRGTRAALWSPAMEETERQWQATAAAEAAEADQNKRHELAKAKWEAKTLMERTFASERTRLFKERLEEAKDDCTKVWQLVRNVGRNARFEGSILKDKNGDIITSKKQQAKAFVRQYAAVAKRSPDSSAPPKIRTTGATRHDITWEEWKNALAQMKNRKAPGIDEVTSDMLKRLSQSAQLQLVGLLNQSLATGDVPESWRTGNIIPLLKPGKNATEMKSYRPVTLTSHLSKVMERIIAARVVYVVGDKLQKTQFGFRHGRSTIDAVARLVHFVTEALNEWESWREGKGQTAKYCTKNHRAAAVLVDFSSAFDTIDHSMVISKLRQLGVQDFEARWLRNFLCDRRNRVSLDEVKSPFVKFTAGVPQGTVLGPLLFVLAMDSLLARLAQIPGLLTIAFADDLTLATKAKTGTDTAAILQQALDIISDWCEQSKMKVNTEKTKAVVFTTALATTHESTPSLTFRCPDGTRVGIDAGFKLEDGSAPGKLLGVCLDARLHFTGHVRYARNKTTQALTQLAVISRPCSEMSKESLKAFSSGYAGAKLLYGLEIIYHYLSDRQKELLDRVYRTIMRRRVGLLDRTESTGSSLEADEPDLESRIAIRTAAWYERLLAGATDQAAFGTTTQAPPSRLRSHGEDVAKHYMASVITHARELASAPLVWAGISPNQKRVKSYLPECGLPPWWAVPQNILIRSSLGKRKGDLSIQEQRTLSETAVSEHGEPDWQIWTDGSSYFSLIHDGPGAAASGSAAIIVDPAELVTHVSAAAGLGASSKTAEERALLLGLRTIVARGAGGSLLLVATDSQSTLKDLERGPLRCSSEITLDVWQMLAQIASQFGRIVIQHVFGHCGLKYNDMADEVAERATHLDQTSAPLKMADARAIARAYYKARWRAKCAADENSHRVTVWGAEKPPVEEASWPRKLQVAAAMIRTNASPTYGPLHRMLHPNDALSCRFCCPQDHSQEEKRDAASTAVATHSQARVECPLCGQSCVERAVLKKHMTRKHPGEKLEWAKFACGHEGCQHKSMTQKERQAHWSAAHGGARPKTTERRPSTGPPETLLHLLRCTMLAAYREKYGVGELTDEECESGTWTISVRKRMENVCKFVVSLFGT